MTADLRTWGARHPRRAVRSIEAHPGAVGRMVPAAYTREHVHRTGLVAAAVMAGLAYRARVSPRAGIHTWTKANA